MQAIIKRIAGLSLAGKADSDHWVSMDTSLAGGGNEAGASPMELVLIALGGCTSMDVLSILAKKRVTLQEYECQVEAERAEEHPRIFTRIHIRFIFYGDNIPVEAVERAIALSNEKYCSVSAMLRKAAEVRVEYDIRPGKEGRR
ncbi:MAG TPA: OsmC family protein [bacterium]|nr:OsmC family protein [bacterium]HQG44022.1 OsmC family protein [bacterium]HQI49092.1 OsmC family protein [bacterium]HQJ65679.1 OsmC family protein [bacterium]